MRLRQSDLRAPGYRRVHHGRGFRYFDLQGAPVTDPELRQRFTQLVIPPAWRDVWICPWPTGHIQATGIDAAGRRQYLYHPRFREQQEQAKHEHVLEMAERLPLARERISADLARRGLVRERVLACAARLLDFGFFRVGSDQYVQANGTYGLTTVLCLHVDCRNRETVAFDYPAKGGKRRVQAIVDEPTRKTIAALLRERGTEDRLLAYRERRSVGRNGGNGDGWHEVHSDELNAYLKEICDLDVSAKDFRTWHATVLAAVALAVSTQAARTSPTARKRAEVRAVKEVAEYLGNTPAVCRASYINPRVIELYEEGRTIAPALTALGAEQSFGQPATQGAVERAVLDLLKAG
ncbi:MAG TPA: DNA topoisomerase IB [Actinocrinis sp.]|uniref:DNA topoisomerase IB n=1 Tax=Actinocrinis sp. TaxID=1920516 RepID=UPI002D3DAC0A|nr:DNA topoisomerase IB [Actinocrinis sp.]HZU56573.1 DNA topoisomerase IB [Actinocrinis sp.]